MLYPRAKRSRNPRLNRALSAIDTGSNINFATGATYDASGALTSLVNGQSSGFAGITNTFSYNKRLQPVNMSASSPAQTVFSIGYDFHLGSSNAVRKTSACRLWRIIAWRVTPMTLPATCSMTACTSTAMTRRAASARWINPQHVISFPGSSCVGIRHPLQAHLVLDKTRSSTNPHIPLYFLVCPAQNIPVGAP